MGTGLLHWRRETAPPRTARFSAWRRMRVARWSTWKRPLSRSGSSTSFSSSSRSEISRCTRDCRRRARLTKTSTFCSLPVWLESWEAWTTAVTAASWAAPEVGGEQLELVGVRGGSALRLARGRVLAAAQRLDEGAQVGLAAGAGAAQGVETFTYGLGGAVGCHSGDHDAREGDADGSGEHGPQGEAGARTGGADGEEHGRAGAERHRDGGQDRQAHQLRPYRRLGQRRGGAGDRSSVPAALTAVRAGGRCAKLRHRSPCTGYVGGVGGALGGSRVCTTRACAIACRSREPRNSALCRPTATHSSRQFIMSGAQLTKSPGELPPPA